MGSKMQIIIPMSGFGERFRRAGYVVPKPLIKIDGKSIIAHVVDLFPGEADFTFIVNQDHLDTPEFGLEAELKKIAPDGKIIAIAPHKLGPINAVLQVIDQINLQLPTVVNYCDFTCLWDWTNFKRFVSENQLEGCLPAYKGFHPHSLGVTNYAYIRETEGRVQDIQEKKPFTDDRMDEYASSGTYYFSSGQLMKDAFEHVIQNNLDVNGEFYVSMAYKYLAAVNAKTFVYPLQHFMQWGTPEDVAEYKGWSETFKRLSLSSDSYRSRCSTLLMPMAGLGKRFKDAGYETTKPLIPVSGLPMVIQSAKSLPAANEGVFALRTDMEGYLDVEGEISKHILNSVFVELDELNDGQARTVREALNASKENGMVVVGACDNGLLYDSKLHDDLMLSKKFDLLVWVARGHANAVRRPEMFGWAIEKDGLVSGVSVKSPLGDPSSDPIVIGTMSFKNGEVLKRCLDNLFSREGKVNGEFYLDSIVEDALALGLRVGLFQVDSYVSWGTPNDLRTFEYWQSCFELWDSHPYSVENDRWVPSAEVDTLRRAITLKTPAIVGEKLVEI